MTEIEKKILENQIMIMMALEYLLTNSSNISFMKNKLIEARNETNELIKLNK